MPCACPTHRALLLTSNVCTYSHIFTHINTRPFLRPTAHAVRMPNAQGLARDLDCMYTHINTRPFLRPTAHALHPIPPQSFMRATNSEAYFYCPSTYGDVVVAEERGRTLFALRNGEFVIACHCHVQLCIAAPSSTTPTRTRIPRGFAAKCSSELSLKSSSVHYPFEG